MQNLYPLFGQNRILKKELLWSLRDYSFAHVGLEYEKYGQGILKGCQVQVKDGRLTVSPGMIKYGQFICLMTEPESVVYAPTDRLTVLKMRFGKGQATPDYILYQMGIVLDEQTRLAENEFEVCRYRLQTGARLRETYKSFEDMETEYDILNHIHASWGALRGGGMCPAVTERFAQEILQSERCGEGDMQFAYLCLGRPDALPRDILLDYVGRRNGKRLDHETPPDALFREMCAVLRCLGGVPKRQTEPQKRRMILVD